MGAKQSLFRLVDQNGAASAAQSQELWDRFMIDVQQLCGWHGTNPFADFEALDHWELGQADVTHLYLAMHQYRLNLAARGDRRYRRWVQAVFTFLEHAVGRVWMELATLVCSACQKEVPSDAAYCIHCGVALRAQHGPQPQTPPPQFGKTRRLR